MLLLRAVLRPKADIGRGALTVAARERAEPDRDVGHAVHVECAVPRSPGVVKSFVVQALTR